MAERTTRRQAIRRIAAVGAALALGVGAGRRIGCKKSPTPPNIVVIVTDDQRWDAMSCAGHPFVRTPYIDRIAEEGIRFTNAFVTTSLCAPSRASFLTGAYAYAHGVRTNDGRELGRRLRTFPALLHDAGYETALLGKWHMRRTDEPRPGFDYWLSFVGQGSYISPILSENGRRFRSRGYMTDLLTEYALRWLRRARSRPFCLWLAHKAPHEPFTPAPRHADLYRGVRLAEPPSFNDSLEGKPRWQRASVARAWRHGTPMPANDNPVPEAVAPAQWDPQNEDHINYFRTLAAVDESVGAVLQTLERLGVLDSTVVVFASDNGFFHGEHHRGDKRLMYEEGIRIPLLMRYPPLIAAGRRSAPMVLNIDLAPTLLDIAGLPRPRFAQGHSLKALLEGSPHRPRQSFLYEHWGEPGLTDVPDIVGVRTRQWKYATYPEIDDLDELYDLVNDPHEMRNLAADPGHAEVLREMQAELARLRGTA